MKKGTDLKKLVVSNTDVLTFSITGTGITASSFAWLSTGGSPNYVAAHVQGIPLDGAERHRALSARFPSPVRFGFSVPGFARPASSSKKVQEVNRLWPPDEATD